MKTTLIINPKANQGQSEANLNLVRAILDGLELPVQTRWTEAPRHGIELARQAAIQGSECVVAVGGDGTCNEVVNGLMLASAAGCRAKLALIPVGSGNDFAYALGVPAELEKSCLVLKNGKSRAIDIAKVTVDGQSRYFDNGVGLGFDGEVVLDSEQARYFQGFFMYLWSVFRVLVNGQWPYTMIIDDGKTSITQSVTLITVANGCRAGGGFFLTPGAQIDDGILDVCCAGKLSKLGVLDLLPRTLNGSHMKRPAVTTDTITKLKINVEGGVPAHIDGEVLCVNGREFEFEIIPGALQALIPR